MSTDIFIVRKEESDKVITGLQDSSVYVVEIWAENKHDRISLLTNAGQQGGAWDCCKI